MERLTEKLRYVLEDCIDCISPIQQEAINRAIDRLATYEETELAPEDFKRAFTEDTLLKLTGQLLDVTPDRLRELAQADKEGRCVVLPCEVGSTVYMPFCDEVVEKRIGQFLVNGYTEPRIWTDIDCDWATTQRVRWDLAFGKTVFLTREEAEAALRREQE